MDTNTKITANRQKKIEIVAGLNTKIAKSKAIIFTNYTGVTHKQLEALKKAIKPMDAEYVVAKNSLILRALDENKINLKVIIRWRSNRNTFDLRRYRCPAKTIGQNHERARTFKRQARDHGK